MTDPALVLGVVSGLAGVVGFVHQIYRKRQAVAQLEDERRAIQEERDRLEKEKEEIKADRDQYQEMVSDVRSTIRDIQTAVSNGAVNQSKIARFLDQLEASVLPRDEQVLSKLDRVRASVESMRDEDDGSDAS